MCDIVVNYKEDFMNQNHNEEARYHFIMMDFVDLIGDYGYDTVMDDLSTAIADKVNRLVQRAVAEDNDD
jgi:hypothetical protein